MLWKALLLMLLPAAFALPTLTDLNSLVVSSTEPTKTEKDAKPQDTSVPSVVPKISEMKIDTNVTNRFAKTRITSKVKNVGKTAQEATFAVVLPETAYISGFVMEIDGKSYEAYIKEKEEAKRVYDEAVSSGMAAAHVEANARDSNRFTVSVNVAPESKAVFKLSYEELLQRKNDKYELILNIHPGQPVKDLNVEVKINETRPLKFVNAPSLRSGNEISKNDENADPQASIDIVDNTTAVVKFSPDMDKQKQLATALKTSAENGLAGQFVVQYDVERDPSGGEVLLKDGYFVHFFAPQDLPALPKQIVFVLDTSGSMEGNRIKQLKEAMNSILDELKPEDVFSIVEFSTTVRVWDVKKAEIAATLGVDPWSHLGPYNQQPEPQQKKPSTEVPAPYSVNENNIENAKKVIDKLSADGGTDIKYALETGLNVVKKFKNANKEGVHQSIVVFLTDGEPTVGETYPDKIISAIQEANSGATKCPIFSLSFGDGADRDFLQKISLKNLGFARHIYEAADASLQLQAFYKEISSPLLNNVTFKYVSNATKLTRTFHPIFFAGSEIVIAGELPTPEAVFEPPTVSATGVRGPIELVPPQIENPVGALERLWAYLTVKQILEDRDAADNKTALTRKALELALKYSFVTPVSSLVVVKPNDTAKAVDTEDASKSRPIYPGISGFPSPNRNQASISYPLIAGGSGLSSGYSAASAGASPYHFHAVPAMAPMSSYWSSPRSSTKMHFAAPQYTTRNYLRPSIKTSGQMHFAASYPPMPLESDIVDNRFTLTTGETAESTTVISDLYQQLKQLFPWLEENINEDGSLKELKGDIKLATNETITENPKCSNAPSKNATEGICKPLLECPQVHSELSDYKTFLNHHCEFETKLAGICCSV